MFRIFVNLSDLVCKICLTNLLKHFFTNFFCTVLAEKMLAVEVLAAIPTPLAAIPTPLSVLASISISISSTGAAPTASFVSTALPAVVYNNDRNAVGRLDSSPLRLCVQFGVSALAAFAALFATEKKRCARHEDAVKAVLARLIRTEVVLVNGRCPKVYCDGAMVPVPEPVPAMDIAEMGGMVTGVILRIPRCLPLSSSHGNAPMRIAVCVDGEVVLTRPFAVHSKKSKTAALKMRHLLRVPLPTEHRRSFLRDVRAAVVAEGMEETETSSTRPTKTQKTA